MLSSSSLLLLLVIVATTTSTLFLLLSSSSSSSIVVVDALDAQDFFQGGPPIRDLSDSDFEDVTQAGIKGGTTTGDWLLFFYAPWCGHCKTTMPVIEEFANKLFPAHGVQTARIDCNSVGSKTCRRFGVRAYPTIMFLKGGKLYSYESKYKRTSESLTGFAKDPVKSGGVAWPEIPQPLTFIDEVAYWGKLIREDFVRLSGESPMILYGLIGACGLLFLMILALAVSQPKQHVAAPQKKKKAVAPATATASTTGKKSAAPAAAASTKEQKPDKKND